VRSGVSGPPGSGEQLAWSRALVLDLGAARLYLQAEIRRLACRACGRVRTETVPWARPGARFTRDFEDVVAYLAQRTDKTTITRLLRCSWEAVAAITVRVVAGHLDDARLDGLYRIGIDEVSYRKGHRYLTVVADHDRAGAVVWAGEGMSSATLERFFDTLGPDRTAQLQAASMDLHGAYAKGHPRPRPPTPRCAPTPSTSSSWPTPPWTRSAGPPGTPPPRRRRHPPRTAGPRPPRPRRAAGKEHPLGAAEGPGQLDRHPTRHHRPAAPRPPRPVPRLGAQGGAA
jgi:hypothetical protein